jgi:hypothetical protein
MYIMCACILINAECYLRTLFCGHSFLLGTSIVGILFFISSRGYERSASIKMNGC